MGWWFVCEEMCGGDKGFFFEQHFGDWQVQESGEEAKKKESLCPKQAKKSVKRMGPPRFHCANSRELISNQGFDPWSCGSP